DPEFMLYQGFLSNQDKNLCEQVRCADARILSEKTFPFSDRRLGEMLFRYRARNFLDSLDQEELHQWEEFRFHRLNEKLCEDYINLEKYHDRIGELSGADYLTERDRTILEDLRQWGEQIL